jgi:hypothetical protein
MQHRDTMRRRVQTFNALVGVYLQDVPQEFCGNLVVFPGSHTLVAEATRDARTMELLRREGSPPEYTSSSSSPSSFARRHARASREATRRQQAGAGSC